MHHRDNRTEGELPFETEPDVDHDRAHREQDTNGGREGQVTGNRRSDHFNAAEVVIVFQFATHHGDRRLLGILAAFLRLDTDQNVLWRTEILRLDLAEVELAQAFADIGQIGFTLLGTDFDDRTALEVDTEVQTLADETANAGEHHSTRQQENKTAISHERNITAIEHGGANALGKMLRTAAANPETEHPRRQRVGREDGGDDTDSQRHGEALDRTGTHVEQHAGNDQCRQVGVDNRRESS